MWHVFNESEVDEELGTYAMKLELKYFATGDYTLIFYLRNETLKEDLRDLSNAEFKIPMTGSDMEFWLPRNKAHSKKLSSSWKGGVSKNPHEFRWVVEALDENKSPVASCLHPFILCFSRPPKNTFHSANTKNLGRELNQYTKCVFEPVGTIKSKVKKRKGKSKRDAQEEETTVEETKHKKKKRKKSADAGTTEQRKKPKRKKSKIQLPDTPNTPDQQASFAVSQPYTQIHSPAPNQQTKPRRGKSFTETKTTTTTSNNEDAVVDDPKAKELSEDSSYQVGLSELEDVSDEKDKIVRKFELEIDEQRTENVKLKSWVDDKDQELDEQRKENVKLKSWVDDRDQELNEQRKENVKLKSQVEERDQIVSKLNDNKDAMVKDALETKESIVRTFELELDELRTEIKNLKSLLDEKDKRISDLLKLGVS